MMNNKGDGTGEQEYQIDNKMMKDLIGRDE